MTDEVIARIITEPAPGEPKSTVIRTVMNRQNLRIYSLLVSRERRAGKFTRVAEDFMLACEADLEAGLRRLAGLPPDRFIETKLPLITCVARDKAEEKLEALAAQIIFRKVLSHPSRGITLDVS